MKLFSKLVFLCNVCFIAFVILRYIEFANKKKQLGDNILPLPFLTGTLVVLGQLAIFFNFIFCFTFVITKLVKRMRPASPAYPITEMDQLPLTKSFPKWLVIFNFILLLIQLFYFFIY